MPVTFHKDDMIRSSQSHRRAEFNGVTFDIFTGAKGEALNTFSHHAFTILETPGESMLSVNGCPTYRRRWKHAAFFNPKSDSLWHFPQRRFNGMGLTIPDAVFTQALAGTADIKDVDFRKVATIEQDLLLKPSLLLAYLVRNHDPQEHSLLIEQLLATIAGEIVRRVGEDRERRAVKNLQGLDGRRMQLVLDYINDYLDRHIRLRDLAELAGVSECHFSRSFAKVKGMSPMRYIMERRIERAQVLLRSGRQSLAEVALAAGFCSQSHFTTAFKEMTGYTPAKFRETYITVAKGLVAAVLTYAMAASGLLPLLVDLLDG